MVKTLLFIFIFSFIIPAKSTSINPVPKNVDLQNYLKCMSVVGTENTHFNSDQSSALVSLDTDPKNKGKEFYIINSYTIYKCTVKGKAFKVNKFTQFYDERDITLKFKDGIATDYKIEYDLGVAPSAADTVNFEPYKKTPGVETKRGQRNLNAECINFLDPSIKNELNKNITKKIDSVTQLVIDKKINSKSNPPSMNPFKYVAELGPCLAIKDNEKINQSVTQLSQTLGVTAPENSQGRTPVNK